MYLCFYAIQRSNDFFVKHKIIYFIFIDHIIQIYKLCFANGFASTVCWCMVEMKYSAILLI